MQEILTAVTYLVVWLICQRVIGIESGLTTLLISLAAAFSAYVLYAILNYQMKKRKDGLRE
jgi:multisubunit Na+/H+ antiporter MnhE subunit